MPDEQGRVWCDRCLRRVTSEERRRHRGGRSRERERLVELTDGELEALRPRRPRPTEVALPCAKVLGAARGRTSAFRPVGGQHLGDELRLAVRRRGRGAQPRAALAGCLQNTGEGGLSPYHRKGGELIFQLGTASFGCRHESGRFDLQRLKDLVAGAPVPALEIKLSQGAKPGLGGCCPVRR